MLQNGIQGLSGSQTVCAALGALLNQLSGAGTISLSTSGPPSPDNSLLQHPEFFGNLVLVQRAAGELACIDPVIMKSHPYRHDPDRSLLYIVCMCTLQVALIQL